MDYEIADQNVIATKIINSIYYANKSKIIQCFIDNRKTTDNTTLMSIAYFPIENNIILNYAKHHFLQCNTELLYLFKFKIINSMTVISEIEILNRENILKNSKDTNINSSINISIDNPISFFSRSNKVGRNDKCPCGSGLKYKKCCLKRHS